MSLNPKMLDEMKDVIFNKCDLPDSVKEPVHLTAKLLATLENAYSSFLSREVCGEMTRANPIVSLIDVHGGNSVPFVEWFSAYEKPVSLKSADGEPTVMSSWGT